MALIFGNKVYTNPHEISSNDSLVFPRYKLIRLDTTLNLKSFLICITYGSIVKWIIKFTLIMNGTLWKVPKYTNSNESDV